MSVMVTIAPESVPDLISKLTTMIQHCTDRMMSGWEPFQKDETWDYILGEEISGNRQSCSVCREFADMYRGNLNGAVIPSEFPSVRWLNDVDRACPEVHEGRPELHSYCHCEVRWMDRMPTLTQRLADELQAVSST